MDTSEIFSCTLCGQCCEGFGGTLVTPFDIKAIAAFVGLDAKTFEERYCRSSGLGTVLAQGEDNRCVFFEKVCTIHPVKPRMCRRWPFIPAVVREPSNWPLMAANCPGMKKDADLSLVVQIVTRELDLENG